jgi:DNA-binding GntR family transcriptional regulator
MQTLIRAKSTVPSQEIAAGSQRMTSHLTPLGETDASVYRKLKTMVINHEFKPGEKLQIIELADRLGVSGTPVREALNRLHAENLLLGIPNKGFFTKLLNLDELMNLHRLSHVLVRHAIDRHCDPASSSPGPPQYLIAPLTQRAPTDRVTSAQQLATAIEHLFESIAALSQNEAAARVVRNALDRTHYIRRLDIEVSSDRPAVHGVIVEMFERIRNRDTAAATKILDDLLTRRLTIMPRLVKEGIVRHYIDAARAAAPTADSAAFAGAAS